MLYYRLFSYDNQEHTDTFLHFFTLNSDFLHYRQFLIIQKTLKASFKVFRMLFILRLKLHIRLFLFLIFGFNT